MKVHILRAPESPQEREKALLDSLDKYQRRYVKRWVCGLCEKRLGDPGCGAYFPDPDGKVHPCSEETRLARLRSCLENYKPRPSRRVPRGTVK